MKYAVLKDMGKVSDQESKKNDKESPTLIVTRDQKIGKRKVSFDPNI